MVVSFGKHSTLNESLISRLHVTTPRCKGTTAQGIDSLVWRHSKYWVRERGPAEPAAANTRSDPASGRWNPVTYKHRERTDGETSWRSYLNTFLLEHQHQIQQTDSSFHFHISRFQCSGVEQQITTLCRGDVQTQEAATRPKS